VSSSHVSNLFFVNWDLSLNRPRCVVRTGTEQLAKSLGKSKFRNEAAQNPTRAAKQTAHRLRTSDGSRIPVTAFGTRTTKDWLHPHGRCMLVLLMENNLEIGT